MNSAHPRIEPGPGQESVWDYPRPPRVEISDELVIVRFAGVVIAETRRSHRVLETSHAPSYYIPREDVDTQVLRLRSEHTFCEFKGVASYADLVIGEEVSEQACWWYADPSPGYEAIRDAISFYPDRTEACVVNGETVIGVPGGFYGDWITSRVVGPFKGGVGTAGW